VPRVYRSMKAVGGKPLVGRQPHALGVRVEGEHADVNPDNNDQVHPNGGGMSVAPSLRLLLSHLVPRRLRDIVPGARAKDDRFVWSMGDGDFVFAPVAPGLHLRPDSERHGVIEPSGSMELTAYEMALVATRDQWSVSEE
jgi:hypothetical protein